MGKRVKAAKVAIQEEPVADQPQEEEVRQKEKVVRKPIEKYLPHDKYIARRSKQHQKRKQEVIGFIKLDKDQVKKAVVALKKFINKTKNINDLFKEGNEGFLYLEVDMGNVPENLSVRPIQIPLPHPIYSEKYNSRFAVFSRDPESDYAKILEDLNVPLLSEVIGYDRAKKHFRDNRQKLKLLNANDLFFCDWRIYNLLRKPLGKLFYEKKRQEGKDVDCQNVPKDHENYQQYVNGLLSSSYTMLGNGPVYTLKIGRLDMDTPALVQNIMRGAYRFLPYILEGVDAGQVRQIAIKGYNSPSLPIYNHISSEEVDIYKAHEEYLDEVRAAKEAQSQQ